MSHFSQRQIEIIQVSIGIIAEQGIQRLTIKNIAQKINISEPAIYRHFKNKIDILIAILTQFKNAHNRIASIINANNTTSIEKIRLLYSKNFQHFTENPTLAAVLFSEEIFQNDKRLASMVSSIMHLNETMVIKIITEGQEKQEIRDDIPQKQIGLLIMGTLRLLVTRWKFSDHSFNLIQEGIITFESIKTLIQK